MDWHQVWTIVSLPDNIPIVAMLFLVPFYTWYGLRQSFANDRLIAKLEADPQLAKTHHRKTQPQHPNWDKMVHVWPYLLRIEFLVAIIVTVILIVWSITLHAPLEEPANPNLTMNPSKAPWYFLGLQEMLVYFDPWIAGVVLPSMIIVGLMAIPYVDVNPLGNGYYTYRQRKFSILVFAFGFIVLWVSLIMIGTFIRGPGWMWFWPGQTWDHHRLVFEVNQDLDWALFGIKKDQHWARAIFGLVVVTGYVAVTAYLIHQLFTKKMPQIYAKMKLMQYATVQIFLISMFALPVKVLIRQLFNIKYVWVTPWFNI